jgi:hypothetical protein
MRKKHIAIIFTVVLFACLDEQHLELPSAASRIVIDALISDQQDQSYVTIGWSGAVNAACRNSFSYVIQCEPTIDEGPFKVNGMVTVVETNTGSTIVIPFQMNDKKGMVKIQVPLAGTPGYKYSLTVDLNYNGEAERYVAESTMLPTPEITDISYEIREGDVGKSDNLVPLISFQEPVGKHYYLFQLCEAYYGSIYCGNSRVWSYSLIEDTFLPPMVERLSIDDGASIAKYAEFYPWPQEGHGAHVRMYSIDKTTYNFYKSLIDQFDNDGGAFSPAPATPAGNISGNAIGLFRATQESFATVYY